MDSICAVIDAQGFYVNNEFFPRELAYARMDMSPIDSYESIPIVKFQDLSVNDKKLNKFIMKYTGLPYDCQSSHIPSDKMKHLIAILYNKCYTEDKPIFGIRNHQFGRYLATIGLPYLEIDCPSVYTLMKLYEGKTCDRHILKEDGMCAVHKVDVLRNWIIDNLKYNK